jgi:hypothetical protein
MRESQPESFKIPALRGNLQIVPLIALGICGNAPSPPHSFRGIPHIAIAPHRVSKTNWNETGTLNEDHGSFAKQTQVSAMVPGILRPAGF